MGAAVDVWHASALGVYSDESSQGTVGETFLRGIQITDAAGQVTFKSIFPGWYAGRTSHIHVRVYTGGTVSGTSFDYTGASLVYTGQMFFAADISTAAAAVTPCSNNKVSRTTNAQDRVYTQQRGTEVLTATTGNTTDGYHSSVAYTVAGPAASADSTSLSMTASHTSLVYGHHVTLSGTLLDTDTSAGLSAQKIAITGTTSAGKTVRATTTGPDGT